MNNKKLLVHLHLYYQEQLDYFIKKLKNIHNCDWDLYVTICESNPDIERILKDFKPDVNIIQVKNIGYDVWPFIQVLRIADIRNYDYVLKLHTKASYGCSCQKFDWRNRLVDSLIKSPSQFKKVYTAIQNNHDIGFVCAKSCYYNISGCVPEEKDMLRVMMDRLGYEYMGNMYLSGTMFLARISCFNKIINSDICEKDFSLVSKTGGSSTNAHVLERVITQAVLNEGCKISLVSTFLIDAKIFLHKAIHYVRFKQINTDKQKSLRLYIGERYYTLMDKKRIENVCGTEAVKKEFLVRNKGKMVGIFAGYCPDGKITDAQIYYLKGLKEFCDNVIFVADSKIFPEEIEKIKDLVCYCEFGRHNGYDFLSYRKGYEYAFNTGLLEDAEELVMCNDSCYAPVFGFDKMFGAMSLKACDFWGITSHHKKNKYPRHIQSYFYVFKANVFNSQSFKKFISSITPQRNIKQVIKKYELRFSQKLEQNGFKSATFVPDIIEECPPETNKTFYPLTLIEKYKMPLVKVKVFNNLYAGKLAENPYAVLKYLTSVNPELSEIIKKENNM